MNRNGHGRRRNRKDFWRSIDGSLVQPGHRPPLSATQNEDAYPRGYLNKSRKKMAGVHMKRAAIMVVTFGIAALLLSTSGSAASTKRINSSDHIDFAMDDSFLGMRLSFAADLEWDSQIRMVLNHTTSIRYSFSPGPASLSVFLPLGDYLGFCGVKDASFVIPLGDTPIRPYSISLTKFLGIPKSIASVNLVIEPLLSLSAATSSAGSESILTREPPLIWQDWCEKTISYKAGSTGSAVVSSNFCYTVSLKMTLTMLASVLKFDLLPSGTILTLYGSHAVLTEITVEEPTPSWFGRNGLACLSFLLEGCAFYGAFVLIRISYR